LCQKCKSPEQHVALLSFFHSDFFQPSFLSFLSFCLWSYFLTFNLSIFRLFFLSFFLFFPICKSHSHFSIQFLTHHDLQKMGTAFANILADSAGKNQSTKQIQNIFIWNGSAKRFRINYISNMSFVVIQELIKIAENCP